MKKTKIKRILTSAKDKLCNCPQKVTIPYDIAGLKAGDIIETSKMFMCIADLQADLEEKLEEANCLIDNLRTEIDGLHSDIKEFYRPVDPYKYNGVSRSDFH